MSLRMKKKLGVSVTLSVIAFAIVFFSVSSFEHKKVEASAPAPVLGDVVGWGWGASTEAPNGGVGWINFSCKSSSDECSGPAGNWGVTFNTTHDSNLGKLSGYAWSNNLGWLSFRPSDVSSCFANGSTDPTVAQIVNLDDPNGGLKIIGWGKFLSGNDDPSDGWDGCVSFTKTDNLYRTTVQYPNGRLGGYAWGSEVVGWISFDCNGCNATAVISQTAPTLDLTVSDPTLVIGSGNYDEILKWTSNVSTLHLCQGTVTKFDYPNPVQAPQVTNWTATSLPNPSNVDYLGVRDAPNGLNKFSTRAAAVTSPNTQFRFNLTCRDSANGDAPVSDSATVYMVNSGPILGCMDSADSNYNPYATADTVPTSCANGGGGGGGGASLQLLVSSPTLIVGSGNYTENLSWTSNDPASLHSCVGSFKKGSVTTGLSGWTGNRASPNISSYGGVNPFFAAAPFAGGSPAGTIFTFVLTCQDSSDNDNDVVASATVSMIAATLIPKVDLSIVSPDAAPFLGPLKESIPPAGFDPFVLGWESENVSSCTPSSVTYQLPNGDTPIGSNSQWNTMSISPNVADQTNPGLNIAAPVNLPTIFKLSCIPTDTVNYPNPVSASVCMGIDGYNNFAACNITNTGMIPSYREI